MEPEITTYGLNRTKFQSCMSRTLKGGHGGPNALRRAAKHCSTKSRKRR